MQAAELGKEAGDVLDSLLERLHKGEKLTSDRNLLRATAKDYVDALQRGYGNDLTGIEWDSPDFATLEKLTENVYQFAAAKNYHELKDLSMAVRDGNRIRTFEEFQKEAEAIIGKYNRNWLRAEYDQAVAAAQAGARWNDYKSRSEAMPYLQYQCVMDGNTRPEHAALHGVIKRIDDPFWDKYYPPNGWGCRCEVVQLPGSSYKETPDSEIHPPVVAPMFQVNFGKQGVAFPEGHAYFRRLPDGFAREAREMAREEVRRVIANAEQYVALKDNSEYKDVDFDWTSGGLKGTHIRHGVKSLEKDEVFFKELSMDGKGFTTTQLEYSCQDILYRLGDSAILCEEGIERIPGQADTALDLLLNDNRMDIKSITSFTENYYNQLWSKNRQLGKFNRLPYVTKKSDSVCFYFHDHSLYNPEKVKESIEELKKPRIDKETGELKYKNIHIKHVYCVINEGKGHKEVFDVE